MKRGPDGISPILFYSYTIKMHTFQEFGDITHCNINYKEFFLRPAEKAEKALCHDEYQRICSLR